MLRFLGIGAQKSGTSWLFQQLRRHPQIFFPAGKEIHFWDSHLNKGIEWYASLFRHLSKIEGDITPAYAILSPVVIQQIHSHFPDLRLIYIIRDPVERAWSAALMEMQRAGLNFNQTPDEWFINQFNSEGSKARSNYRKCIRNWLEFYAQEQLLILPYSDIAVRPKAFLERCASHLNIDFKKFPDDDFIKQRIFKGPGFLLRPQLREYLFDLYYKEIDS